MQIKRKTGMSKYQLSPYDLMVVSKYFESIDDFINMEIGIPKTKGNMSKFHYNPIPLDAWSRTLFTSLETYHVYSDEDEPFVDDKFFKRIIWFDVTYDEWIEYQKEGEEYKHVVLDKETARRLGKYQKE